MTLDDHNRPEPIADVDRMTTAPPPPPRRPGDLPALLAILAAGLVVVLVGHLDVTATVTLLTALVGLYGAYRRS